MSDSHRPTMKDDAEDPATKAQVREETARLRQEIIDLNGRIDEKLDAMVTLMKDTKDQIITEFKVLAENIHVDVTGANRDEISLLKNQKDDHEERITKLEKQATFRQ